MGRRAEGWTLRRDARTGKLVARFRIGGRRFSRSTGSSDRAVAQATASKIYREVVEGDRRERRSLAGQDIIRLVAAWLGAMSREVSEATVACWKRYVDAHWIPFFETAAGLSSEARIADYMRHRLEHVTRSTVKKELSALRRFLAWTVEQGYLGVAPPVPTPSRRANRHAAPEGEARARVT